MARFLISFLFLILVILATTVKAESFGVVVPANEAKCFGEQVTKGIRYQVSILVLYTKTAPIDSVIKIFDDSGTEILQMEKKMEYLIDITVPKDGTIQVCIYHKENYETHYQIDIKIGDQIQDKDYSVIKKTDMKIIERLVLRWQRILKTIHMNMDLISRKTLDNIQEADTISYLVKLFSGICAIVVVVVAIAQTRFVKMYFKRRKLI